MFVDTRTAKIWFFLCVIMWSVHTLIASTFCLTFHPSFITFCPLLMFCVYAVHQVSLTWQNKSKQIKQMVTSFRPTHDPSLFSDDAVSQTHASNCSEKNRMWLWTGNEGRSTWNDPSCIWYSSRVGTNSNVQRARRTYTTKLPLLSNTWCLSNLHWHSSQCDESLWSHRKMTSWKHSLADDTTSAHTVQNSSIATNLSWH